jgi:hypothetical protein
MKRITSESINERQSLAVTDVVEPSENVGRRFSALRGDDAERPGLIEVKADPRSEAKIKIDSSVPSSQIDEEMECASGESWC